MARGHASTRELIEAIVLAFSRSDAKSVVRPDALRMVLNGAYGSLLPGGRLDLNVVWGVMGSVSGLARDAATPPFCLIKTWEPQLGLDVDLPAHLKDLSPAEVARIAAGVPVGEAELTAVLEGGGAAEASPAVASAPGAAGQAKVEDDAARRKEERRAAREAALADPAVRRRRQQITIGLGVVAFALFAFAGWMLVSNLGGPSYKSVAVKDFAGDIPLRDVKQLGDQVIGTLSDEEWLSVPDAQRQTQLEDALRNLEPARARSLVIFDAKRTVRASAQWSAGGKIVVKLL